jgi:hypothetical protein
MSNDQDQQTPSFTTIDDPYGVELVTRDFMTFGAFSMTDEGLMKNITIGRVTQTVKVSDPFEVIGLCRNPDGLDWGVTIRFRDPDQRLHVHHISSKEIHCNHSKLAKELEHEGLYVAITHRKDLAEYLNKVETTNRITIVNRGGKR